jgi:hypothetical protein
MLEVNTPNLESSAASDPAELLALIEQMAPLGPVLVTDFPEGYEVLSYLRRYTAAPLRVILWISMFLQLMEERMENSQPGAVLENFGRLLFTDVTIYVASMPREALVPAVGGLREELLRVSPDHALVTLDDLLPKPPLDHLFRYIRAAGRIVPLEEPQAKT